MNRVLARYGGRPFLVALATANAITGIVAAFILAPLSFGLDAMAFRDGATAIAAGTFDVDFLYTPLAGLVARPLTWMPPAAAAILMTAIGLAILVIGVVIETRGLAVVDRVLILVAALTFLPVVNELLLGQITMAFVAAIWFITRREDRLRAGIPLGVLLGLAPKPLLLPFLLWLFIRRPRSFWGAALALVATLCVGLLVMGWDLHAQWLDVLMRTGSVSRNGNLSLFAGGLTPFTVGLVVIVLVAAAAAVILDEDAGLPATLLAGLLVAPYTLLYAATILLAAVRPALRVSPGGSRVLALVANLGLLAAFAAWAGAGLATMVGACVQGWRAKAKARAAREASGG